MIYRIKIDLEMAELLVLYMNNEGIFLKVIDGVYNTDSIDVGEGPSFDNVARRLISNTNLKITKFFRINNITRDNKINYVAIVDNTSFIISCLDKFRGKQFSFEFIPFNSLTTSNILNNKDRILSIITSYSNNNYHEIPLSRQKQPWE